MIILTAAIQTKKGKENELETVLRNLVEKVAQEEGCPEYRLHKSKNNAGRFYFYEKYADQAAFEAHCSTEYMKRASEWIKELSEGEAELDFYEALASNPK